MTRDFSEKRFMDANRSKEKQIALNELKQNVEDEFGIRVDDIGTDEILRDIPLERLAHNKFDKLCMQRRFNRSLNGQICDHLKPLTGRLAIVEGVGWSCPIGKLYGVDYVLAINIQQKTGTLRKRNNTKGKEIWHRFEKDLKFFERNRASIYKKYADCRNSITSVEFWEEYLEV
jgi:hypothetical protein